MTHHFIQWLKKHIIYRQFLVICLFLCLSLFFVCDFFPLIFVGSFLVYFDVMVTFTSEQNHQRIIVNINTETNIYQQSLQWNLFFCFLWNFRNETLSNRKRNEMPILSELGIRKKNQFNCMEILYYKNHTNHKYTFYKSKIKVFSVKFPYFISYIGQCRSRNISIVPEYWKIH